MGDQISDEAVGPMIGQLSAGGRDLPAPPVHSFARGFALSTGGVIRVQTRSAAPAGGLAEEGLISGNAVVGLVRLAGLFTAASRE